MITPESRLAFFVSQLTSQGKRVKVAQLDMTDPCGYIMQITWSIKGAKYDACLVAAQDLPGFSVYKVYKDEDLSEDNVLFEFENDNDVSKV